jgi:hypothetical protein
MARGHENMVRVYENIARGDENMARVEKSMGRVEEDMGRLEENTARVEKNMGRVAKNMTEIVDDIDLILVIDVSVWPQVLQPEVRRRIARQISSAKTSRLAHSVTAAGECKRQTPYPQPPGRRPRQSRSWSSFLFGLCSVVCS